MILNRQRDVRVSVRELGEFLSRARRAPCLPADAVTVCLVTNSEIARWNRAYRGKMGPTDVLSFPVEQMQRRRRNQRRQRSPRARKSGDISPFGANNSSTFSVSSASS